MRRVFLAALALASAASLAGCPAKPKNGECKTSQDCEGQQGFGKVCVEGRCQECSKDADCKEGFVCRTNKCVPKPECAKDADCGEGKRCENERCVASRDEAAEAERRRMAEEAARGAKECGDTAGFTVRFGFDQSTLSGDAQGTLQKLADCLKKAPPKHVLVQGNCDERGTTQYNIALGARRAEAARKYLADLGVGAKMETVSYGKEKPVCTQATEECWAKNRRDEFQVDR